MHKSAPTYDISIKSFVETLVELLPNYAGPTSDAPLKQARPGDAGTDLYSAVDIVIRPGERAMVPTGIKVALPTLSAHDGKLFLDEGLMLDVRPKSGLAAKMGLTVLNTPGTIDAGYRGEIAVILYNSNPVISCDDLISLVSHLKASSSSGALDHSFDPIANKILAGVEQATVTISRGQKIAQLVGQRYNVPHYTVSSSDAPLPVSERGEGGFGSTGLTHAD